MSTPSLPGLGRRLGAALVALTTVVALSGCDAIHGTGDKQYIDGTGEIIQIAPADRGKPIDADGTDLDGNTLDLSTFRGKVVMLNVWANWCPPCRAEMPTVVSLSQEFDPTQVQVLGVNIRESGGVSSSQAFVADHDMTFPSFYDPSSAIPLKISSKLGGLYSLPSTAVLDRQGRLAALVIGEIPGKQSMADVVNQVEAEPVAAS